MCSVLKVDIVRNKIDRLGPGFFDLPMNGMDDLAHQNLTTFIDDGSSTSSAPPHPSSSLPLSKERKAE